MTSAISFLLVCLSLAQGFILERPMASPPSGKVRGSIMYSRFGSKIYAFRGIRYAEPPVGKRRFQVSVPAKDWNNVFDASFEGPACPQPLPLYQSEDCLRLNVYTTKLPSESRETLKKPVMVFFHPGSFSQFSGQSIVFGPQYMLDKDVVLVTVNYRLSTLGMISTGDALAPGNLALKDQVLSLRWVQRNIETFGGDPNSVTITGGSAGARSVILHMMSPMSKGLFHRVIAMGGSPIRPDPLPTQQRHLVMKQAQLLNCPTTTTQDAFDCLKTKSAQEFGRSVSKFTEWRDNPVLVWSPVVEPEIPGVERFLPGQPVDLIREGKLNDVPLICGITRDEFSLQVMPFMKEALRGDDTAFKELNRNWDTLAPINFVYERGTNRSKYISENLRQFYCKGKPISLETAEDLGHIYADSLSIFPVHRGAKLLATYSKQPVYLYKFTYQGRKSLAMWNFTTPFGVVHQDELQYVFYMFFLHPILLRNDPDKSVISMMTSIWSNFIHTGQPIPVNDPTFVNVTWNRYEPEKDNYLEINVRPRMQEGLYPDRMQEWEKLFPL